MISKISLAKAKIKLKISNHSIGTTSSQYLDLFDRESHAVRAANVKGTEQEKVNKFESPIFI